MQDTFVYIKAKDRQNITAHASENDRFLRDNGKQFEPLRRKGRSSYGSRSFGFHRGREGVGNGDINAFRGNGCSGMRYETGEDNPNREGGQGVNCDDRVSPSDHAEFQSHTWSSISPSPLQETHNVSSNQLENYAVSDEKEVTAPSKTPFRGIISATISSRGSQRTGRNENYKTDLVPYGYTGSRQRDERIKHFENLRDKGRGSGTSETSRNGRQTMADQETRQGEVMQYVESNAVAEPRQKDVVSSYYDFLINEGSYKFWAAFQVITAILLIYSAFAAIYYAKYTFSMMDYPDYLDDGFFFKRSGEAYVTTTTTARPASYSFLGLSSQTFQRIMNALSSKNYS